MKKYTGFMVVLLWFFSLSSCVVDTESGETLFTDSSLAADEPVEQVSQALQDPQTEATGDCQVSISCSDGSSRSCSGTNGSCSASGSGAGSVTCNGGTVSCPLSCGSDGVCNSGCSYDPDCDTCVADQFCKWHSQCGPYGACVNRNCICLD